MADKGLSVVVMNTGTGRAFDSAERQFGKATLHFVHNQHTSLVKFVTKVKEWNFGFDERGCPLHGAAESLVS